MMNVNWKKNMIANISQATKLVIKIKMMINDNGLRQLAYIFTSLVGKRAQILDSKVNKISVIDFILCVNTLTYINFETVPWEGNVDISDMQMLKSKPQIIYSQQNKDTNKGKSK